MRLDGTKELNISTFYGTPQIGYFGVPPCPTSISPSKLVWYKCREVFHYQVNSLSLDGYFYRHGITDEKIAEFIYKLEEHLKIEDKCHFSHTSTPDIIWISVSRWWTENWGRHQFLTMALRAALGWEKDENWIEAMRKYIYAACTLEATNRFLDGYTDCVSDINGWVSQFATPCPTPKDFNHALLKPEPDRHQKIEKIAHDLWNVGGRLNGKDAFYWATAIVKYKASRYAEASKKSS